MVFLHPVFTILFVFLVVYSFLEVYADEVKKSSLVLWLVGSYMILAIGLRGFVGADYGVYRSMYLLYFQTVEYSDLFTKARFGESKLEVEWLYITLNKIVFFFGSPFYLFTLVSAIITVGAKLMVYYKNSPYPVFSILLFLIPAYFIGDSGHMRQALGMVFCLVAYKYIKERNMWMYLLCMYVAIGFHKSTIVFFPMYWVAVIPLNSRKIFALIATCVILSPFQVYNLFSTFLNSLNVQDLSNGINGYIMYEAKSSLFMDALIVVFSILVIVFDKPASEKVLYYEYMRNVVIVGLCLYFIMRDNPVFSTRLVGSFMGYIPLVIPSIVYSLGSGFAKKALHFYFVIFMIFYYFVFASYQGDKGNFTPGKYENQLWRN